MSTSKLEKKIADRSAMIGIIGLGHTGLPLAVAFIESGFSVHGIDVDEAKIKTLKKNRSYHLDISDETISHINACGRLTLSSNKKIPPDLDCVIISVPTPLNKTKDPDVSYILDVIERFSLIIHKDMLIVLQSTTYPGTTRELVLPILEKSGLKAGTDFFLSYSPERFDPGNKIYTMKNIPRVVGGITKKCTNMTCALFETVVDAVVPTKSSESAEMVKLLENTFRSVNIGLINEVAIMCDRLDLDVWEVIEASSTKPFGFMTFYPGPGIGGHCIPVDPQYLSWKLRLLNYKARFVELAGEINSEMPEFVVSRISNLLNDSAKAVKGSKILLLGMAYKRNSDDYRESPGQDIMGILQTMGARIKYHDPYISELIIGEKTYKSVPLTARKLSDQDIVVIITDHDVIDYGHVVKHANLIFDTRNVLRNIRSRKIFTL
ncbi:nucleotide sugar dehydrogenase [candidate division KSB1 bacterium]